MAETSHGRARILLVDDEPSITQGIQLALRKEPFDVVCADSGHDALALLARDAYDVVVSDECMPGMQGSEFLALVRQRHPDVVRIILSGQANLEAALRAINSAEIFRFLVKPCPPDEIGLAIHEALSVRDQRRRYTEWAADALRRAPECLAEGFEHAMRELWPGFQPIVRAESERLYGYEALLRSDDASWAGPVAFFSTAQRLGRSVEAGRRVRALIAERVRAAPGGVTVFVNVNPVDLEDRVFLEGRDELAAHARRVVIEITERDSLKSLADLDAKVRDLRAVGYRIAVDDVGAGYAGLTSLALLVPDIVKLDMDLVRDIDRSSTKRKLVGSMVQMCRDLGIQTLSEGIETRAERDVVVELGCELLQGYYYGRATREFAPLEPESERGVSAADGSRR